MSDSRLEKFIYAICSMDVTDLPVPLSRIEKLWNCLITGETPDFEPLSRNEKYLMAMLDRYDISNLPAPMSRGEKLLYKIAVGETDLSDVPGYLSRYEELLKYLIENGGIGFEYVLHTLNQSLSILYTTAEKPVKSAILKGNTLLVDELGNECEIPNSPKITIGAWINTNTGVETASVTGFNTGFLKCPTVTFVVKGNNKYKRIVFYDENKTFISGIDTKVSNNSDVTIASTKIPSNAFYLRISASINTEGISYTPDTKLLIEDVSGNNLYSTQLVSVKMPVLKATGKNLFDKTKIIFDKLIDWNTGIISDDSSTNTTDFIKVIPNTQYTMSFNFTTNAWTRCFGLTEPKLDKYITDANGKSDKCYFDSDSKTITFTTSPTTNYLIFSFGKGVEESFQIEQGSVATSYEPFKSNILTVNEEVELGGIGDVQDTLDCLTGEIVQSIGEIVLDGSENWVRYDGYAIDGYTAFITTIPSLNNLYVGNVMCFISCDFPTGTWSDYRGAVIDELVWNHDPNRIGIRVKNEKASNVEEIKTFLSTNNIRINYKLTSESIKTVDLTTVDQDNQPTRLGTFENITHVSLESAGLIPEVEMEVATRISKELASASPLMDNISMKQEQLETTVDEQSNNVDATMIATTEIFEETL